MADKAKKKRKRPTFKIEDGTPRYAQIEALAKTHKVTIREMAGALMERALATDVGAMLVVDRRWKVSTPLERPILVIDTGRMSATTLRGLLEGLPAGCVVMHQGPKPKPE